LSLILRSYHAIGNDLFFTDVDLGFFVCGHRRAYSCDFILFERALGLAPSHPQAIELGDKIFGLDPQFFS
jgi:hypothetical protein